MAKLNKKQRRSSIGRFLLDVIKPTPALSILGKHGRDDGIDEHATQDVETQLQQTPRVAAPSSAPACIALQNEDAAEDAVVITALDVVPFCCHADLITMTHPQLITVATTLNAKLPHAMQIDTDPSRPAAFIRHSIELLVGLRDSMPQPSARRAERPRSLLDSNVDSTPRRTTKGSRAPPSSPASPLANRSRLSMSFGTPSLAILAEDSQEDEHRETTPQKRRRTESSGSLVSYTGPITRAQSRRVAPLLATNNSPSDLAKTGVLRTRSVPLPLAVRSQVQMDSPGRPTRVRSGAATKRHSFAVTSTPKKRTAAINSPERGRVRRPRSLLIEVQNIGYGVEREGLQETAFEVGEVTFGLDDMTMPYVSADEGVSTCN